MRYPLIVGHEIIGKVIQVGSQAGNFRIGDVVGVGCQSDSCLSRHGDCDACEKGEENYCPRKVSTYNSTHANSDKAQGRYALYNRTPGHFVVKIPLEIAPKHAAPMLCAGLTVYSPLKRYKVGPGKSIGIIGIGGLGHFAILFVKAIGSRVVALSQKDNKRRDAFELGADDFISTENENWASGRARTLDIIINTISSLKVSSIFRGSSIFHKEVTVSFWNNYTILKCSRYHLPTISVFSRLAALLFSLVRLMMH